MASLSEYAAKIEEKEQSIENLRQQTEQQRDLFWNRFYDMDELPEVPGLEDMVEDIRRTKTELAEESRALQELKDEYLFLKEHSCASCGTQLVEGAKFCHICGAPVQQNQPEPEPVEEKPVQRFCKSCGNLLKPHARFCANCGADVQQLD